MKEAPISEARWKAIWDAFHEVLEGPAAERDALLERACGGDAALRREVEELLAADEKGLPVLDELSLNIAPTVSSDGPQPRLGDVRLEPGRVLAGRFQIVGRVGAGGMGEVYEARDRELGRRVAVKTLLADKARSAAALARFRKEIHLAQQVTHRNVCRVFDLFRDGDLVFLTMELLEGETLAARLQREGRLGLPETKLILEQVAAALEAAHEVGVIHRDLKPANVLLVEESTGPRAVVTDFGLATSGMAGPEEAHLTRTGEVLGTPAYMAPEQLEGRETGPATDVYALGLLLYEMVTGKRPFEGSSTFSIASRRLGGPAPSPRNHVPDLDERWERVILRCLERDPANRFQHPREVVEPLREDSAPLPASGIVPWRRRWMARTAAIAALAILVIAFFWWKGLLPGFPGKGEAGKSTASNNVPSSTKRETVLVADFDNRTGDQSLDGAGTALARELESSHLLTVAADGRIADSLRLMRRPADSRLDASLARQVALRDGGIQSVLTGKIVRSNEDVALTVSLIAADSGAVVKSWTRKAGPSSAAVQAALRQVGLEVRRYLGENPRQIQESGERLAKVTTPSLAALRL
jgi:serine/threonine protein kinase